MVRKIAFQALYLHGRSMCSGQTTKSAQSLRMTKFSAPKRVEAIKDLSVYNELQFLSVWDKSSYELRWNWSSVFENWKIIRNWNEQADQTIGIHFWSP